MSNDDYQLNGDYKNRINHEILTAIDEFRSGKIGVIAISRKLGRFESMVQRAAPDLAAALITFVAVDDETDALPIGRARESWHPSTAAIEDEKVRKAEELYYESVRAACNKIVLLLV